MNQLSLENFDQAFLETIKDYKKIHLVASEGTYYTICLNHQPVGVIGFKSKEGSEYFLKIGIHQNFRGQGIFPKALALLVAKHHIHRLYSTIALANIASVKTHQKAGFIRIPKAKEDFLHKHGFLLKRNIRMYKDF